MWVPLHVHSQYSILDALTPVKAIAKKAAEHGMPAVALTDHGNMYGAVEFFQACKGVKVKPIIGCEVYVAPESRTARQKGLGNRHSFHLVLLAKDREGYHNLCKLTSAGFLEGHYYVPRIDEELLARHAKGLICLSACLSGRIAYEVLEGTPKGLADKIEWYHQLFGEDYYLELQRHSMREEDLRADGMYQESWLLHKYQDLITKQERVNEALIQLSLEKGIKLVATNDSHYTAREDWRAHEILLNVQSGEPCEIWENDAQGNPKRRIPNPKRHTYASHECYFKSAQQMLELFEDVPDAISNTLEVAEKCQLELDFQTKHYPVFVPPNSEKNPPLSEEERQKEVEAFLWKLCNEGIPRRYTAERLQKIQELFPDKDPMLVVQERLEYEMNVIAPKGMCDYLLIVWDFIDWAKKQAIPMGPGRGSGAGSIVLYLIGVTDIEPIRFSLFFERFINPERISYPDIDVDICMDRRGDVIHYTLEKYGKENVAQIITFMTMKAKSCVRDVGRVLNVPLARVNAIAKLVPDELGITIETALEKDADLRQAYDMDDDARRIIDIGRKLEGSIRSTGTHAAGVIVAGEPLTDFIPLCVSKDAEMAVTQYSMKPVEEVGMLKIDFLGLKTLTSIQMTVDAIKRNRNVDIDWINLPLDDAKTFELLNQGKTLSVFQLESGGMQELARQLHLDKFEEIIAVGALYRPGPMDMIPSFIARKHGREPIEYDHPWVKDILSETYGIMVYQEQVMQIASRMANYSLGEGDVLRRAMGKKEADKMAKQREKFRLGALQNDIAEEISMRVFDKMEKFAAYGFNKSHATAYGYLSYVTGYLKANYPGEWLAANMTCEAHDLTKVSKFIREGQAMEIPILPPDINESSVQFEANEKGIRFAMAGIKGVGTGVVEMILQERQRAGRFKSFWDFCKRLDLKKVGKKNIECLIEAGCFEDLSWTRDQLMQSVDLLFDAAVKERAAKESGVMFLFAAQNSDMGPIPKPPKVDLPRSKLVLLLKEKELLGLFLTGHPMDNWSTMLKRLGSLPLGKIDEMDHDTIFRTAFLVESVQSRISAKNQKKFAILTISDGIVHYELPIWSEMYEEKRHLLEENKILLAVLQVDKREESARLSCHWLEDLTCANESLIQQCDAAYDRVKQQSSRMAARKSEAKRSPEPAPPPPPKPQPPKAMKIKINIDSVSLSQVLSLRTILEQHAGSTPVEIEFAAGNRPVATLQLDTSVTPGPALEQSLKSLSSVI